MSSRTSKRTTPTRRKQNVRCEVCGRDYATLTAEHLRGHGLTRERYRRLYTVLAIPTPTYIRSGNDTDVSLTTVDKLAQRITGSVSFLDSIADEVADHILSAGPLRTQVAFAAAQIIQARMAIHADAVGRLARITDEMDAGWRITQGGANSGPTPTKDLVLLHASAHSEIVKAEEMVLKAARLALDESKAAADQARPSFSYSAEAESIPIPRDLSPADREGLRALMGNLTRYVDAGRKVRGAITVAGVATDPVTPTEPDVSLPGSPTEAVEAPTTDPVSLPDVFLPSLTTTALPRASRRRRKPPRPPE